MDGWSRAFRACQNCRTTRRSHVAKGYCGLCLRQMRAILVAQQWDRRRRETLKGVPTSGFSYKHGRHRLATDSMDAETFGRFRAAYIVESKRILAVLKSRERCWLGERVDGLDVEYQLRHIARLIRPRTRLAFYGRASSLRRRFGAQGLVELARLLDELQTLFPWQRSWGNIYAQTYATD
jgi:hypothetical protein